MDQGWAGQMFDIPEERYHGIEVVAIDGAEIAQTQLFENQSRSYEAFQSFLKPAEKIADGFGTQGQ